MVSLHLLWIALSLLSLGLYGVVRLWPEGGTARTFSQHVADHKAGVFYYIFLFTLVLPIFAAFFFFWFIPTYHPPILFGIFIFIGLLAQYLCTFIPETGTKRSGLHRSLAFISALGLLLALFTTLFGGIFSTIDKTFIIVGLLAMAALLCMLVVTRANHPKVLYIQTGYFVAFFASITLVAYV